MIRATAPGLCTLRLKNFKAFREVSVEFAPLTILLGANSTGKSAILHALVLLKQSLRGGDYRVPLTFGGPLLDLGGLQNVLWQHESSNELSFRLTWDNGQAVTFDVTSRQKVGLVVNREEFRVTVDGKEYRLEPDDAVTPWYFSFEVTGPVEKAQAFLKINATIREFFDTLRYVGPLRQTSREYSFSGEAPESVGPDAQYLIPFLLAHSQITKRISTWLRKRQLADALEVRETARGSGRWAVYLRESKGRRWNLVDTGFGYTQMIPVLAELYGAPEGGLILIEQPELHLHPRLAVEIGDLLVESVREGKRLLVETHSEHLVLRVRRRIAEGKLSADRVALYFVERSREKGTSSLRRIPLNELGQLEQGWPDDFWGDKYKEALEFMRVLAERQTDC